ncbi:DUF6074 family protein [Phyllobacterium sp. SB3]|uniref:DUF6074 family protein n=1 Tax=Phyllobacterium sp. SB3 TaxID=3156073 RepID=UPI0032AFD0C8
MSKVESSVSCQIVPFPLTRRLATVRDVAAKLKEKNDRHAEAYRNRIADELFEHLARIGLSEDEQDEQVGAFFSAVELEMFEMYDPSGIYGDRSVY